MNGAAQVDAWIAKLRQLPDAVGAETLAPIVEADLKRTASAGTSPDGTKWKQRKDGGAPLAGAAAKIVTVAAGNRVITSISGPEAIHNWGTKKDPKRQILPTNLPDGLIGKLRSAAAQAFRRVMGGR